MNAILINTQTQALEYHHTPDPIPRPNEALIEVHYTALNRADLSQRAGHYPPPPGASEILGLELSGVIQSLPENVAGWKIGDKVCALLAGGGYAEKACVPVEMLMPIPNGWSLQEAAAMPEAYYTAYLNLFIEAGLQEGEQVLIHGGASGVGMAAIQLAKEAGCKVFTTVGSVEKENFCKQLGADVVINYKEKDFVHQVKGSSINVILDMVGAHYFERNLELLTTNGRMVFIATLSGAKTEIDIRKLMAKRILLKGSTLRARPLEEKVSIKETFMNRFWKALETKIRPVIDSVFDIQDAEKAHVRMKENLNMGKMVLKIKE
jgi:putative PIG3 family NAD(P)H quinone oxidoreductase